MTLQQMLTSTKTEEKENVYWCLPWTCQNVMSEAEKALPLTEHYW